MESVERQFLLGFLELPLPAGPEFLPPSGATGALDLPSIDIVELLADRREKIRDSQGSSVSERRKLKNQCALAEGARI
jgi:hypothetical protein